MWQFIIRFIGVTIKTEYDVYKTRWFSTFEECFHEFVVMSPLEYSKHPRYSDSVICYDNGKRLIYSNARDGFVECRDCEEELGITKTKLLDVITISKRRLKYRS